MIYIALILAWMFCSIVTYAIVGYINPDEVEGEEALSMFVCLISWPLLMVIGFGYFVVRLLSKLGDWLRGFLTGLIKKDGDKE